MEETLLKKEFKERDLSRIRNLIRKDFTEKTRIGVGYEKREVDHKEGDVWEEKGKQWTIHNGIRQNVTKLDNIKKLTRVPLRCPRCGGSMKHWLAKKMYKIHGFCFDPCTVLYEANLKKAGLYEKYEREMMKGNMKGFLKDLEDWVNESLDGRNDIVTEQGDVEEWSSLPEDYKRKVRESLKGYSDLLRDYIE